MDRITHAGGVVYSNGKYLIVASSDGSQFVFPKGHIEAGETPEQTAIREIEEEAGIIATPLKELGAYSFNQKGEQVNCVYFLMRQTGKVPSLENRRLYWLTFDEAKQKLKLPEPLALLQSAAENIGSQRPA